MTPYREGNSADRKGARPMRKVSLIAALALAISLGSSHAQAQAQAARPQADSGAVIAAVAGMVIGGSLVYYYSPLSQATATALGAVLGGAVGSWWYGIVDGDGYQPAQPRKTSVAETGQPFQLISYGETRHPAIRAAD
jgi:hypothetical protein